MGNVFEAKDRSGRLVHLSRKQWLHINPEHPEVSPFLENIREAIRNPSSKKRNTC